LRTGIAETATARQHDATRVSTRSYGTGAKMNSNLRNLVIVALVVAVGVLGYLYYQQRQHEGRVEINLDKNGLTIQKN
jgi:uncharacterized protein HemX